MELDELKQAWHELDRRLEANEQRAGHALREVELGAVRLALRRHGAGMIFEVLCGVVAIALLGRFLADYFTLARFALPAIVLLLAAVASTAANLGQIVGALRIDYAAGVIAIQRQIAALRAVRSQSVQWTFLLAPLMWTPLAIVAAQGLWDLDIYSVLGPTVVAINLSVGLAVIPLAIRAARMCADSLGHSPGWKRIADSIAGHSLTRAMESVRELERFEEE